MSKFKQGDKLWRGFARTYDYGATWYPDIRPCTIVKVNDNGTYHVNMLGPMPTNEPSKSRGGTWVAWSVEPECLHRTPEKALRYAKTVAADANINKGA